MRKNSPINSDILISNIKKRFNLSDKDIIELSKEKEITIPVSIFNNKLGMLESISLYLKDELNLSFNEISILLKRDYKTIWTSYNKARKKAKGRKQESKKEEITIPISIFNENLGMLESISLYLKGELNLSFKDIAKLLKRDYKTIWTSYNKARVKNG